MSSAVKLKAAAGGSVTMVVDDTLTTDEVVEISRGTMTGTISNFTSTGIDDNATSTAITIDASENVGIGTTSPSARLEVNGSGLNTSQYPLDVISTWDRYGMRVKGGSAGGKNIANFQTYNGTAIASVTGYGLTFNGETAAANALDDYEEGTFSGTISGNAYKGRYVKIGNTCTVQCYITTANATGNRLASVPFAPSTTQVNSSAMQGVRPTFSSTGKTGDNYYLAVYSSGTTVYMYANTGSTQGTPSAGTITFNLTYTTI